MRVGDGVLSAAVVLSSLTGCNPVGAASQRSTAADPANGSSSGSMILLGVENVPHQRLDAVKETVGVFARPGLSLLGRNNLKWRDIEPEPPTARGHRFEFEALDREFRVYSDAGMQLQVTFLCRSGWATVRPESELSAEIAGSPPKEAHWDDFATAVAELIERYDGDGIRDAFPRSQPLIRILTLQEEVEFGAHWGNHGGTVENYGRLLSCACEAAKRADPSVLVARAGASAGTLFDLAPTEESLTAFAARDSRMKAAFDFLVESIDHPVPYDLFSLHINRSYTGLLPYARFVRDRMRRAGYERPLMIDDGASINAVKQGEPFASSESSEVLGRTAASDLLAHQSSHTVKLVSLSCAAGMRALLLTGYADVPGSPFRQIREGGFIDSAKFRRSGDVGTSLKPAYAALTALARRIARADRAELIVDPEIDPAGQADVVRFSAGSTDFHVAWARSGTTSISLEVGHSPATVVRFGRTDPDGGLRSAPEVVTRGRLSLVVGTDPVLVE